MNFETMLAFLHEFGADALGVALSLAILAAYYVTHKARVRRDPSCSIHVSNELARRLWLEDVMSRPGKDVMAVQTMRNFIMYPILMVSTSTLLIIGTLTLTGQAENISRSWHTLNFGGSPSAQLWIVKVICLLADFLVAFFAYTMAIRMSNHVLFMMNIPKEHQDAHDVLSPARVARLLNRAGYMVTVGMRAFIFAIPLVFWLFGPVYLVLATAGVAGILSRLDRHR